MIGIYFSEDILFVKGNDVDNPFTKRIPLNLNVDKKTEIRFLENEKKRKNEEILFLSFGDRIREIDDQNFIRWSLINIFSKCFSDYNKKKDRAFLLIPSGYSHNLIELIKRCLIIYGIDIVSIIDINLALLFYMSFLQIQNAVEENIVLLRQKETSLYVSIFKIMNNENVTIEFSDSILIPMYFQEDNFDRKRDEFVNVLKEKSIFNRNGNTKIYLWLPKSISDKLRIQIKEILPLNEIQENYNIDSFLDFILDGHIGKDFNGKTFYLKKKMCFGIQSKGKEFIPIIESDSYIPVEKKRLFKLSYIPKYDVNINLIAGFSPCNEDNFIVTSIPLEYEKLKNEDYMQFIAAIKLEKFNLGTFHVFFQDTNAKIEKSFKIIY